MAWAKQNHRKEREAKNPERKGVRAGGSRSLLVLRALGQEQGGRAGTGWRKI